MFKITSNVTVPKNPHVRRKIRKYERFVKKLKLYDQFNVPVIYVATEIGKEVIRQELPYRIVRRLQTNGSFNIYIQPPKTPKNQTVKANILASQSIDALVRKAIATSDGVQTPEQLHALVTDELKQNGELMGNKKQHWVTG
jgi:hypothetical protein